MKSFSHGVAELQKVLGIAEQNWFLGAGASVDSGIPLMYALTGRVRSCLSGQSLTIFDSVKKDLHDASHIEHVLSHLGDLLAIAARSKTEAARTATAEFSKDELENAYREMIACVAETVRYGYRPASKTESETIGTAEKPIVDIELHLDFVREIFRNRSNLESRSKVGFVTTNYDTLLEDALALDKRVACEGFSGGAIGYWDGSHIESMMRNAARAHRVLKLHGSVDWMRDPKLGLLRARYGVRYLSDLGNVLIYPQATKYVETQKDPFARIFDCFRRSICASHSHLLVIVGYSFGDDHINSEIQAALEDASNKMVIVAFSREVETEDKSVVAGPLLKWLQNPLFGPRVYAATDKAIYNGAQRIEPDAGATLNWWRFDGVTNFLKSGDVS